MATSNDISIQIINTVKSMIVELANRNNIVLSEQFASKEDFKEFVISFTFKLLTENMGYTTQQAFDLTLGQGAYDKLIEELCK